MLPEWNEQLQVLEGEGDKLILEELKTLYSGTHDGIKVVFLKDVFELIEKVFDRCRDAGNVINHIVLKNSSAWLELDGIPKYQVIRFQMIPPSSAHTSTSEVTIFVSTSPEAIVLATAVPTIAPNKLVIAARKTASRGLKTLVDTTVAIEFAVS